MDLTESRKVFHKLYLFGQVKELFIYGVFHTFHKVFHSKHILNEFSTPQEAKIALCAK